MKIIKRSQKFARYTRSLRIYAIIALYRVSLIGPLQPVIHVIQNRHAGEQRKHWGKTNKELISFKIGKKKAPVHQFIVLALPTFTSWTLRSNLLIDDTWSSSPRLARVALCAKCRVRHAWPIKRLLCRPRSIVFFLERELCFYALLYMSLEPKNWSIKRYLVLSLTLALFLCYAFDGNDVKLVCHK